MGTFSTKTSKPKFWIGWRFAISGPILMCFTSKFLEDQGLSDKISQILVNWSYIYTVLNYTEKTKIFKIWEKWKKIIWHCFPLSFKVPQWFWAFFDQPVLFYTILKKIRFVKFAHLQRFFDRPKSYFFSLNSSCATNFGPIFEIFVMCSPPDLGGSNEYFGSLLGSSVLEELLRKSTW